VAWHVGALPLASASAAVTKQADSGGGSQCVGPTTGGSTTGLTSMVPTTCPSGLVHYLVTIPDFAAPASDGSGKLNAIERSVAGIALGLMAAVATVAAGRHYLAGLTRSGGAVELVEGLGKVALGGALVVAWPWLYESGIQLANGVSGSVLNAAGNDATSLLAQFALNAVSVDPLTALLTGNVAGFLADVIVGVLSLVALVAVIVQKIAISAVSTVAFVAAPLAIVLSAIDELKWATSMPMRAAAACAVVPLAWTLIFATFAAVGIGVIESPVDTVLHGTWWASLTHEIVAIPLLYSLVAVPRALLRQATGTGGGGGGPVGRVLSYTAGQFGWQAVNQAVSRGVTRFRGPEAVITRDQDGAPTGYAETERVRGQKRRAAQTEVIATRYAPDPDLMGSLAVWPEPGERPAEFEQRLASARRKAAPIREPGDIAARLQKLGPEEQEGVRSAYRRRVLDHGEDGAPRRDYKAFWTSLAGAAGNQGLSPRARGVYRDLAATAPETLDQVLGPPPSSSAGPSGPSRPPNPGPSGSSGSGPSTASARQPSMPPQPVSPPQLPAAEDARVAAFARWATSQRVKGGADRHAATQAMRDLSQAQRAEVAALWGEHARAAGHDDGFLVEMARRAAAQPRTGGVKGAYLALGAARDDILGRLLIDEEPS
jgi:hypothetical protein